MVTERKLREQEVQIARYRLLKREVTDPLAASLLHIIILELEAVRAARFFLQPPSTNPASSGAPRRRRRNSALHSPRYFKSQFHAELLRFCHLIPHAPCL